MSIYAFDTSVLSAFTLVRRLDLLERRYRGRAAWTIEVQDELSRGVANHPRLYDALVADWLGEPKRLYVVDQIEEIRLRLGGKASHGDRRHLGEAATIVLAEREDYIIAIDDYDATRVARTRGLGTVNTLAILRGCVHDGQLSPNEATALRDEMVDTYERRLPEVSAADFK